MKKKILVTGGAGYIGSVLVGDLLSRGYQVRIIDRFMFGGESLLAFIHNKNLEIVYGDIRNEKTLNKVLSGVEDVIHLAALVGEPACKENSQVTKAINFHATQKLVSLAKAKGIKRFLFSSTCSNYGISSADKEASEDSKLNPLSLYAETKIAAEEVVLSQADKNFHPTVLRLATIFGLSPRMRFNLLVNEFARDTALGGEILVINEKSWRPFLHVRDASQTFLAILSAPLSKIGDQIFNVVGENIQKGQLAAMAKRINPNLKVRLVSKGEGDARDYRVSAKKLQQKLKWRPQYLIEDGFREIIKSIRQGVFSDPYAEKHYLWFDKKVFQEKA